MNRQEALRKQLAAIEHARWSDWQRWLHNKCKTTKDGLLIPTGYVKHLEKQMHTDYADLSPAEQASDMEQVNRYWPLIESLIATETNAARVDENQRRLDKIIEWENRKPVPGELTTASFGSASGAMEVAGFKRSFIERIAELTPPTNTERSETNG
jgi:hypothetical protein